jgi:hypothetical protein
MSDYQPTDTIRFVTPGGNDLTGVIRLMGEVWALVHVEKPAKMDVLLDLNTVMGKVVTS